MMRLLLAALVACAAVSPLHARQAATPVPTPAVSIRGRVVAADNNAVLPRVRLVVNTSDRRAAPVFTDDQGRFILAVPQPVAAAPFTIGAAKAGYAGLTMTVMPADVSARRELQLRLARGAAVSGQVADPNGDPVPYALVLAQPDPATGGVPAAQRLTETDDRGEYRLGGLPAGRYGVKVVGAATSQRDPLAALAARLDLNPIGPLPWADASATASVELRAGDDSTGVNLVLTAAAPLPLIAPPPANLPPGQSGTAAITGRVVSAAGRPLSGAIVRALRPGMIVRSDQTDREGRYSIANLPAGALTLEARKDGYITVEYGQQRANEGGKAVTVRDGETLERIDIVLPSGSVLTGTVVDDYGEPIAGASVRALQLRVAGDLTMALPAPGVRERQTDDRGRYRLFGVLPGNYIVSATIDAEVSSANRADATGYAPVFYPGTTEVARATQLRVETGRELNGVDLVFTRAPTARVAGVAYDVAGQPWQAGIVLFESQRTAGILNEPRKATAAADGSFAFSNVPPGNYVVQAIRVRLPAPPSANAGTPAMDFGMAYVTVTAGDPDPITVRMSAGSTIEGRIVKEGAAAPGARFSVYPFPTDFDQSPVIGGGPAGLTMLDEERFRVIGVTGSRRFTLGNAPPGWYLKSASVNGTEAADVPFDFGQKGGTYRDVEVIVANDGATLSGSVIGDKGEPVTNYGVVVFSVDPNRWFRASPRVKLARPTQTGSFSVDALPPGEYFVAALDRVEGTPGSGEWQHPEFLQALSSRAIRITLAEGETRAAALRLITR